MNAASNAVEAHSPAKTSIFWPERVLGPRPSLGEINLVCWALFVAFLLAPMCVVHWIQAKHGGGTLQQINPDFVYFYGAGKIGHEYSAARIYDYELQRQVFVSIQPPRDGFYSPSPYPPFVALFFAPFTYISFASAYFVWMGVSLALYLTGIGAAASTVFPREWLKIALILCFALAFYPFILSTLLNGQLATIAVCAVGVAVYQERHENLFCSGLVLALLAYKPTLILLILPMLLLTRRFKTLFGFISGAGILMLAGTLFAGIRIWPAYLRMLHHFAQVTGVRGASVLQLWKYIDLNSSFAAVHGGQSGAGLALVTCIVAASGIALAWLLWKSAKLDRPTQWLAWAATLTWTLLLNVYVPIYDSVLVVIAITLTLGALRDLRQSRAAESIIFLAVVIFAVSWKTVSFAKAHRIQLLTVALIILGPAQLLFLYRAIRQQKMEAIPRAA